MTHPDTFTEAGPQRGVVVAAAALFDHHIFVMFTHPPQYTDSIVTHSICRLAVQSTAGMIVAGSVESQRLLDEVFTLGDRNREWTWGRSGFSPIQILRTSLWCVVTNVYLVATESSKWHRTLDIRHSVGIRHHLGTQRARRLCPAYSFASSRAEVFCVRMYSHKSTAANPTIPSTSASVPSLPVKIANGSSLPVPATNPANTTP